MGADALKVSWLRWLAIVPLVPAAPLLFFGLLWFAVVQLVSGFLLVAVAAAVWRMFAGEWEAWPFGERT
jgi:hypothetical protein